MNSAIMSEVVLRQGREKSIAKRHPWLFASAILPPSNEIPAGAIVRVLNFQKEFLAIGFYSPSSKIRVRILSFEEEQIDRDFFQRRIQKAIQMRYRMKNIYNTNSLRLIFGESDCLPGFIVDQYGSTLVFQALTSGVENKKEMLIQILREETGINDIYERSDVESRTLEGLPIQTGILEPSANKSVSAIIEENDLQFQVNFAEGHKTGFYLDQRVNRLVIREFARDLDVLDCFCYTGGFSVNALKGGARSVLSIDISKSALQLCQENVERNQLSDGRHHTLEGDVFVLLRKFRDMGKTFDFIILDPPKFAPTVSQVEKATRGYKDINLLAFKLLRPGGLLATFSCSGGIGVELFQKIVMAAAIDASVHVQVLGSYIQAFDHPIALTFPESFYLKGLLCRKAH